MADLNRTTAERFAARKRHIRSWRHLKGLGARIARHVADFTCDDLSFIEEPFLLLCNHTTAYDPIFVGLALGHQAYFVATENVLHRGLLSRLLMRHFCPIIHRKGSTGLRSAKEIQQTLKNGASVVLFPEGNRTFTGQTMPIQPVTAKLARRAGHVVTMRLEGGYLVQPRWSRKRRKGQVHASLVREYDASALSAMTDADMLAAITHDLYEDACARQEELARATGSLPKYSGPALAEYLESTLFCCPACHQVGTLSSRGDTISCTCGFHATLRDTGFLEGGPFTTVAAWDTWQRQILAEQMDCASSANGIPATLFSDEVSICRFENADNPAKVTSILHGTLKATPAGFMFTHAGGSDHFIILADIGGLAVFGRNTLDVTLGKPAQYMEVHGAPTFNALKYLYVYQELRHPSAQKTQ